MSDLVKLRADAGHPEILRRGATIAPGEPFERSLLTPSSEDDPGDSRLLEEGLIIDAQITPVPLEGDALQDRAKALGIRGRTAMSADELREQVALAEAQQTTSEPASDSTQRMGG